MVAPKQRHQIRCMQMAMHGGVDTQSITRLTLLRLRLASRERTGSYPAEVFGDTEARRFLQ